MKKAIICDIDGTLAIRGDRGPYEHERASEDTLNAPVKNLLNIYKKEGYDILILSGRQEKFREITESWLLTNGIQFDKLYMRQDDDNQSDTIVKENIYKKFIEKKYDIDFVIDDRNKVVDMWRDKLNLTCFQVNYGDF